jgi:hypothetical protein
VVCERPQGCTIVSCKWVHKLKRDIVTDNKGNVTSNKARLVAAGFPQKPGTDYEELCAAVAKQMTVRAHNMLTSLHVCKLHRFNVVSAITIARLTLEVYMKRPPGYEVHSANLVCPCCKS